MHSYIYVRHLDFMSRITRVQRKFLTVQQPFKVEQYARELLKGIRQSKEWEEFDGQANKDKYKSSG